MLCNPIFFPPFERPTSSEDQERLQETIERVEANDPSLREVSTFLFGQCHQQLFQALQENTYVTVLEVYVGDMTQESVVLIANIFAHNNTTIKTLVLVNWNGSQGAARLLRALSCQQQVPSLALETVKINRLSYRNPFAADNVREALDLLLHRPDSSVTSLEFNARNVAFATMIASAVNDTPLSSLACDISTPPFDGDDRGRRFLQQLVQCEQLGRFEVTIGCSIEAIASLRQEIQENQRVRRVLTHLNIEDITTVDHEVAAELEIVLPMLEALQSFSIGVDDGSTPEAINELVQTLSNLPNLTRISIYVQSGSQLENFASVPPVFAGLHEVEICTFYCHDPDAAFWSNSFRNNNTIRRLLLNSCHMTNEEIMELSEVLPSMTALEYLALDLNRFDSTGAIALFGAVERMPNLKTVVLNCPDNEDEDMEVLHIDDDIRNKIFYLCKLREINAPNILADAPVALYDLILTRLRAGKWHDVMYHLIREKCGELCQARMRNEN